MRPITHHAINPANEAICLEALDGPGPGGASHVYMASIDPKESLSDSGKTAYEAYAANTGWKSAISGATLPPWDQQNVLIQESWFAAAHAILEKNVRNPCISFQNGPVKEDGNGVNGITHEVLLAVLIDRLEGFQAGQYANPHNQLALDHLRGALEALHDRTRARIARGVEGTHKV